MDVRMRHILALHLVEPGPPRRGLLESPFNQAIEFGSGQHASSSGMAVSQGFSRGRTFSKCYVHHIRLTRRASPLLLQTPPA